MRCVASHLSGRRPIEFDSYETDEVLGTNIGARKTYGNVGRARRPPASMGGFLERFTSYRFEKSANPSKSEAALFGVTIRPSRNAGSQRWQRGPCYGP